MLHSAANAGRLIDRVDLLPEVEQHREVEKRVLCRQRQGGSVERRILFQLRHSNEDDIVDFSVLEPGRPTNRSHLLNHGVLIGRDRLSDGRAERCEFVGKNLWLQIKKRRVTRRHVRRRCAIRLAPIQRTLPIFAVPIGAIEQSF